MATLLSKTMGDEVYDDFNCFKEEVETVLKEQKIKHSASEKNAILSAVSWYDEGAQKVVKKVHKLSSEKLEKLLEHLGCTEEELPLFGYYRVGSGTSVPPYKYIEYESDTELRDSETIPLSKDIKEYFLEEVKPHIKEAWINLESVKIGYEISFNKYFYQHKPLRSLDEVTAEILELERESEGLIKEILGLGDE